MGNIINVCFVFLIFILITLFWNQLLKMTSEESMCMAAVSIMLGVFVLGAVGHVKYIYYILMILALIGLLAFVFDFSLVKGEKSSLRNRLISFANPSVIMITVIFMYSVAAFRGTLFTYPDELFQWGQAVRYMFESGCLPYGVDFPGASITLSTATMFQYIWVGLRSFVESNCFIGNFLLAFIPVYLPFSGATWKEWKKISLYTLVIFLSFNVLTYVKYYNLLQDFVLPMWAGGIIAWLLWKKNDELNWCLLLGALMCISSMKSMVGPLFAGIVIIVLIVTQALIYGPIKIKDILNKKVIILSAAVIFSVVILNIVWSILINQNVYNRFSAFDSGYKSLGDIVRGIINGAFSVYSGKIGAFPYFSYFMIFALEAVAVFLLRKKFTNSREQQQFMIVFILYEIGFGAYLLIMLYAYARVFSAAESAIVAGLERYLAYYILLGCVPWLSLAFTDDKLGGSRKNLDLARLMIVVVLILGTGNGFITKVSAVGMDVDSSYQDRMDMQEQKKLINKLTGAEGKLCILGLLSYNESKILAYEMGNRYSWNTDCYQMYNRNKDDVETYCDIERYPQLIERLDYDYIWIYQYDGQAKNIRYRYGVKHVKDGDLYKIDRTSEEVRMVYLGNTIKMADD
ncbi:MAG: hypothetical protein K2K56_01045 [Lachnospiraceae bacterium]|nr:hypothetical protein [Lachnospiraceae bacterium]